MRQIKNKHSSKTERIVYEILKELRVPFFHRWKINNIEIDFIVNNFAIEINGHEQDPDRNKLLSDLGYVPIHFTNKFVKSNRELTKQKIKKLIYG